MYKGELRPDYAGAQAYFMTVVFIWLAVWLAIGHEEIGSRFETVARAGHEAFEKEEGPANTPDAAERGEASSGSSVDEKRRDSIDKKSEEQLYPHGAREKWFRVFLLF